MAMITRTLTTYRMYIISYDDDNGNDNTNINNIHDVYY